MESVLYTDHFTRVDLLARNDTAKSLTLLLFQTCSLRGNQGTTLEAEPFKSQWSETLAPGSLQARNHYIQWSLARLVIKAESGITQEVR